MSTASNKHVFISHASKNLRIADDIRRRLEGLGLSCWIAPRDIKPGASYGEEIVSAIETCLAVVLVLTDEANESRAVANELELAFRAERVIIPVRLSPVSPASSLAFYVNNAQWVDVFHSPLKHRVKEIARLLVAVRDGGSPIAPAPENKSLLGKVERHIEGAIRHKLLTLGLALVVIAALATTAILISGETLLMLEAEQDKIDGDPATFGLVTLAAKPARESSPPTFEFTAWTYVNIKDPVASAMSWEAFARLGSAGSSPIDLTPTTNLQAPAAQMITFEMPAQVTSVVFCMTAEHPTRSGKYTARWDFDVLRSGDAVSINRAQAPRMAPTTDGDCQ